MWLSPFFLNNKFLVTDIIKIRNKNYSSDLSFSNPSLTYLSNISFRVLPFFIAKIFNSSRVLASIRIGICTILFGSSVITISSCFSFAKSIFSPLSIFNYCFLSCYYYITLFIYKHSYLDNNITKYIYNLQLIINCRREKGIFFFFSSNIMPKNPFCSSSFILKGGEEQEDDIMVECGYINDMEFERVAAEATARMTKGDGTFKRPTCIYNPNLCTGCGECCDEDLEAEARSNYWKGAF